MKLSAPIYVLKSQAKELKRTQNITLTEALDQIAKREGYSSWNLLAAKAKHMFPKTRQEILAYLNPGDLMLIASRPGLGKTTFTLQILIQGFNEGKQCYFFTLEYGRKEVASRVADIDQNIGEKNTRLIFDFSDDICAEYIIKRTRDSIQPGSLIAVDYLQLLDQKRSNPELQKQIEALKDYAKEKQCIIIFISQIDRGFEAKGKARPSLDDVRLPNPLDLKLFSKSLFLHNGKKIFVSPAEFELD